MNTRYKPDPFYNRTAELAALDRAWTRRGHGGQMMLLYGRRRVGKTYLLQRYAAAGTADEKTRPHCYFLAEQSSAKTQRLAFAVQLLETLPSAAVTADEISVSWNTLFLFLSRQIADRPQDAGRFILFLDEFQYLLEQTPELASTLQAWWDREGTHLPIFIVLSGSTLSTMAALGNENAPLFGRFNAGIFQLKPLTYFDVASFYRGASHYGPADILTVYGALGGTPRYHALVDTSQPAKNELITLLMSPRAILENEVLYLLGSEQIRDPAQYNSVLGAIAHGETQFTRIQNKTGAERGSLSFQLNKLQKLGWIYRELPFEEDSDRRAIYRMADPFLTFWYRFVAPLASQLQFSDPIDVFDRKIAPYLSDYMGCYVFEEVCAQWLRRSAAERLGLKIESLGRYWSRDGSLEVDIVGRLETQKYLVGECKWRANGEVRMNEYVSLRSKVDRLPNTVWKTETTFIMFSAGGFSEDLRRLASDPTERLYLIDGEELMR